VQSQNNIALAVQACLKHSGDSERPFEKAADFFMALNASDGWSETDIALVKSMALAGLMKLRTGANEEDWER